MSTGIFFKKQFIKVNDKYVPMVLSGSSNCFEGGNRRIARDWGNWSFHTDGKLCDTAENILASVDKEYSDRVVMYRDCKYSPATESEVNKSYGWYAALRIGTATTRTTTFGMYRSLFVDGFKKALTIEQLRLGGVSIRLKVVTWDTPKLLAAGLKLRNDAFMYTTEQFEVSMNEWESYYGDNANIYICYGSEGELERMFKDNRKTIVKVKKVLKEVNSCYVIEYMGNRYFIKRTKKGAFLTYEPTYSKVKKYLTEKAATAKLNSIPNNENYKVVYKTFDAPIYI